MTTWRDQYDSFAKLTTESKPPTQAGWSFEQPGLAGGVCIYSRKVGIRSS